MDAPSEQLSYDWQPSDPRWSSATSTSPAPTDLRSWVFKPSLSINNEVIPIKDTDSHHEWVDEENGLAVLKQTTTVKIGHVDQVDLTVVVNAHSIEYWPSADEFVVVGTIKYVGDCPKYLFPIYQRGSVLSVRLPATGRDLFELEVSVRPKIDNGDMSLRHVVGRWNWKKGPPPSARFVKYLDRLFEPQEHEATDGATVTKSD